MPAHADGPSSGPNNIAALLSSFRVHSGGHVGASTCKWYTAAQILADPTLLAQLPPDLDPRSPSLAGGTIFNGVPNFDIPGLVRLEVYLRACGPIGAGTWLQVPVFQPNQAPLALAVSGELVRKYLKPPQLRFEPLDRDFGWAYVHVPIDVRTLPAQWRSYSVTAENDAPPQLYRWVTVTATPVAFTFTSGGGAPALTCAGNTPIAPFDAAHPGACSVVFNHESSTAPGGRAFAVRGEITWKVTYESSGGPGVLPGIALGNGGNLEVAAIKALVSCTSGRGASC